MPIRELSRRIGVSPDLVRKWERRYGVLSPGRTIGNQRLYSRVDEARLRLMLKHVRDGVPAAQAAELASAARFRLSSSAGTAAGVPDAATGRARLLDACSRFDETSADRVLEKVLAGAAREAVLREVFLPFLVEVGERWARGELSVAQEHFATGLIHGRLLALAGGWDRGLGPRALLACPPGEQHTLGLICFGIALHGIGWRITYLGADTPVEALAQAAEAVRPDLIVVAATLSPPASVTAALASLAESRRLGIGGAAATAMLASRCSALRLSGDPVQAAQGVID
jgi:DNA-binding transcriptional MerR regulator